MVPATTVFKPKETAPAQSTTPREHFIPCFSPLFPPPQVTTMDTLFKSTLFRLPHDPEHWYQKIIAGQQLVQSLCELGNTENLGVNCRSRAERMWWHGSCELELDCEGGKDTMNSSRREVYPRAVEMLRNGLPAITSMNLEIAFFISPLCSFRIISFLQPSSLLSPGYLS